MNLAPPPAFVIAALVVIGLGYWIVTHFFTPDARWERRRRRSRGPVSYKRSGPRVKLSVKTDKSKKR